MAHIDTIGPVGAGGRKIATKSKKKSPAPAKRSTGVSTRTSNGPSKKKQGRSANPFAEIAKHLRSSS